jgi:hypothetical protein
MTNEWLAQLSATAAKQSRRPVRNQAQPRAQVQTRAQAPAAAVARRSDPSRRSFLGAIIGSIIRWAILSAISGAIYIFILSSNEYLEDPIGERVLYGIWYLATFLPAAISGAASEAVDANAIYDALKPHAGLLPFVAPLAIGIAVTSLFLPTVNAYRRRFGLRFFILLFNLALLYWALHSGWIKLDLTGKDGWIDAQSLSMKALFAWIVLLIFSSVGIRRPSSAMLPTPAPSRSGMGPATARTAAPRPGASSIPVRAGQVIRGRSAGPTIARAVTGGSWRRPR